MGRSGKAKVGLMMLLLTVSMLLPRHRVGAAITCEQVTYLLIPCISYGVFGGTVAPSCCTGIKTLDAAAKTTEDRRKKCNCIKEGAAKIPGLNYDRVNEIPAKCGTTCPYKGELIRLNLPLPLQACYVEFLLPIYNVSVEISIYQINKTMLWLWFVKYSRMHG
ncbi:hypothetical protein GOBAR_DD32412 [Gossypium barbadense]|nr:hypothetical protein GOBAR_DD32412 [Gossypium barbadense]